MELHDEDLECIVTTFSPQETEAIGKAMGSRLVAGDVVALIGELGSGKTCFTKGVAAGLGIDKAVPIVSPTFTLINEYPGLPPLYHFDLYRIDDMVQILDLGCEEYWGGGGVAVIEWGEKAADLLPEEHFRVEFLYVDEFIRKIAFRGSGARFASLIENLKAIVPAPK